jgi:hypothetical protein
MNNHSLAAPLSVLSLLLTVAGCAEQLDGGVQPTASELASEGPTPTAFAILGSKLPADPDGFLSTAQITVDPGALYVFIGNAGQTCDSPFMTPACDTNAYSDWQFVIGIPAAHQVPGALPLSTSTTSTGVDDIVVLDGSSGGNSSSCLSGTSPDGLSGDVGITSIDATQVTLQFNGVTPNAWIGSTLPLFNAEYVATRCP